MTRLATREMIQKAEVVDVSNLADKCPRHKTASLTLKCPRCARLLWEHVARTESLPPLLGRIPRT